MTYVFKDAQAVKTHINALLGRFPELADDDEFRADVIEGETDLYRLLSKILDEKREADVMVEAIKAREDALKSRRQRYENRAEAYRTLIHDLMESAELAKVTLPEATLSITKARQTVAVDNVDELPQGYYSIEKKPLKSDIKKTLDAGEDVPGARLVTGETGLTIRVK